MVKKEAIRDAFLVITSAVVGTFISYFFQQAGSIWSFLGFVLVVLIMLIIAFNQMHK